MTVTARDLLATFDTLSSADKHAVAAEILRRSASDGGVTELALAELADELFCAYDVEEHARADL